MKPNAIIITIKFYGLIWPLILCMSAIPTAAAHDGYPETIGVLEELYATGLQAWHQYTVFEQRARDESLFAMAKLFAAMAASQSVTLNHLRTLLTDLSNTPQQMCWSHPSQIADTRANLQAAIEMELMEATITLPAALRSISAEKYAPAIQTLQTAVMVHNHHRKRLKKIQYYAERFFGPLTKHFQKNDPAFFICNFSGAIILKKLPAYCPIRRVPTTSYVELSKFKSPLGLGSCDSLNRPAPAPWTKG